MNCKTCEDKGYIDTGNNDLPCYDCDAGDTVKLNYAGRGQVTGREVKEDLESTKEVRENLVQKLLRKMLR